MNDITALPRRLKERAELAKRVCAKNTRFTADEVLVLVEAPEKAQQESTEGVAGMAEGYETTISMLKSRIAELEESRNKLREGMAAIYNAICADGASTSLSAILTFVKRAHEESAAAGI